MEPSSARSETAQQLDVLRARIATGNPEHYRHWALYLQVLRECLGSTVDRCCFQLAVEIYPSRYRLMPAEARAELHQRIASLVKRCSSLLTVEQLLALAAQQRRRRLRLARRQQRRWLESLEQEPTPVFEADAPEPVQAGSEPAGSVHLGMGLPISLDLFAPSPFEPAQEPDSRPQSSVQPDSPDGEPDAAELMQAFARLLESADDLSPDAAAVPQAPEAQGLLPSHPLQLLLWMDEIDLALARRLRNLSHGLNVELVRLGLCPTLPPLRLLEAVAAGQVESQSAPLNLLRLNGLDDQLPAALAANSLAVLLRPADLEADQPRLRTCRSRLRQVRQEVRRMAQTYHRLERRLQALEAEQLWLHDHATARNPRTPQPD